MFSLDIAESVDSESDTIGGETVGSSDSTDCGGGIESDEEELLDSCVEAIPEAVANRRSRVTYGRNSMNARSVDGLPESTAVA